MVIIFMFHKTYRKYITEQVFTKRLFKYVCPIKVSLINYIHLLNCSICKIIYKFRRQGTNWAYCVMKIFLSKYGCHKNRIYL